MRVATVGEPSLGRPVHGGRISAVSSLLTGGVILTSCGAPIGHGRLRPATDAPDAMKDNLRSVVQVSDGVRSGAGLLLQGSVPGHECARARPRQLRSDGVLGRPRARPRRPKRAALDRSSMTSPTWTWSVARANRGDRTSSLRPRSRQRELSRRPSLDSSERIHLEYEIWLSGVLDSALGRVTVFGSRDESRSRDRTRSRRGSERPTVSSRRWHAT